LVRKLELIYGGTVRTQAALYGVAMSRDEDGINNAYWLIFASSMTAVALAIGAIAASIQ
jgi:hypothetical protein